MRILVLYLWIGQPVLSLSWDEVNLENKVFPNQFLLKEKRTSSMNNCDTWEEKKDQVRDYITINVNIQLLTTSMQRVLVIDAQPI